MRSIKQISLFLLLVSLLLIFGCVTLDTSKATILKAYPSDASALNDPQFTETDLRNMEKNGIIYEYSAGDMIQLKIQSHSDIFEMKTIPPITLNINRKLYVFSGTSGFYFSLDGINYKRFDSFFKGSIAVNLGMQKSTRTNNLNLKFDLSAQPH